MNLRIVACVAAVPNPEKVKWDRFRQLLDTQDAEPVLNPADRSALELASAIAKQAGTTFDAICVGADASPALREAAVFGAERLFQIDSEPADAASVAAVLAAAIGHLGGADLIICGNTTASYGTGTLPGYLSAFAGTGLFTDVLRAEVADGRIALSLLRSDAIIALDGALPLALVAAPYGMDVRSVSAIALMRAAKKVITRIAAEHLQIPSPLPATGAVDGALESAFGRKAATVVEGDDARSRAALLVAALREREAV